MESLIMMPSSSLMMRGNDDGVGDIIGLMMMGIVMIGLMMMEMVRMMENRLMTIVMLGLMMVRITGTRLMIMALITIRDFRTSTSSAATKRCGLRACLQGQG